MIVYAPYAAVVFWGTMILLGLRSAFLAGRGPCRETLRTLDRRAGAALWVVIIGLYFAVFLLARLDSETIRRMESPVGVFTSLAFLPLLPADLCLAARLFLDGE